MSETVNHGWYTVFKAKDARFDGRFFVGVSSTGIYCRPVCRAKLPKEENCTYYSTAAEAEQAGYRPCLICRPELAPGTATTDATASLAHRAARVFDESCASGLSLEELARRLGCTDRHLRRAFVAEYRVTPVQYLQTCRLLLAKSLLTDTELSVLDVAMASGFGSLRRFNDLFKTQYKLSPAALRKQTGGEKKNQGNITLLLGYRPPYEWEKILSFLAQRAILGVEHVQNSVYRRTVHLVTGKQKHVYGWIQVSHHPEKNALSVTLPSVLLPVLPQVLSRVKHLFDLHCNPASVDEILTCMNDLRPGLYVSGTRVPGSFDPFEMTVRAVLGQQITVKAAGTLATRMAGAFGRPVQTEIEGLTHAFPGPEEILALKGRIADHLGPLGITGARAETIQALARMFVQKEVNFDLCAEPESEIKKLMRIPGIGNWTAHYIAMRTMGWPDAFLETDSGVKKALAPYITKELLKMAEKWRPWRSYATINLWNSLA